MRTGVIAKKVGMTRLFQADGRHVPVTVLQLEELQVVGRRSDGWHELQSVLRQRRAGGEAVGAGLAMFVEKSGLGPYDGVRISVDESGAVEVVSGAASVGQGMETALAQICADTLGVDYRNDLEEDVYADYQLEDTLDELTFLDDIDKSALVSIDHGHYVIWMLPSGDTCHD